MTLSELLAARISTLESRLGEVEAREILGYFKQLSVTPNADGADVLRVNRAAGDALLSVNTSFERVNISTRHPTAGFSLLVAPSCTASSGTEIGVYASLDYSPGAANASTSVYGTLTGVTVNASSPSGYTYSNELAGLLARATHAGGATVQQMFGAQAQAVNAGTGTVETLIGQRITLKLAGSGGASWADGLQIWLTRTGTGTFGSLTGIGLVNDLNASAVGTLTALDIPSFDGVAATYYAIRTRDGQVVLNDDGRDYDFRVESASNTHTLFLDASTARVGINQEAPQCAVHVGTPVSGYPLYPAAALVVAGADAEIASVSTTGGSWGSAFSLVETDTSGVFSNSWALTRKTSAGSPSSALHLTFGTSSNWTTNAVKLTLTTDAALGVGGLSTLLSSYKLDVNGAVHLGSTRGPTYPAHGVDLLSGHTGLGGFRFWTFDGVDGTARTFINDATGDVAYRLYVRYVLRTSAGTVASSDAAVSPGSSVSLYSDGTNVLTLTVTSAGQAYVQRTAGTATFKLALLAVWL